MARPNHLDPPIGEMIGKALSRGGRILVRPPCANVRGDKGEDLVDGAILAIAVPMLEVVKQGVSTRSF